MAGYDPKKAALYNKLRQSGISENQAWTQAGLTDADENNYVVNDSPYNADGTKNLNRGQMGAFIVGQEPKVQPVLSAEEKAYRASIDAAGAGFDERLAADSANFDAPANVARVDYPVKASSGVSTKTVETYTSTSTEQVSGGGSTTVTAGQFKANAQTQALQSQIDAKQAELTQSYKDNPVSNRGREKAGLPLLTPDQLEANQRKALEISKEKVALGYQQQDAGTPSEPTVTTVPNTTTTESTTTYSKTVTNSGLSNVTSVQTPGGPDPVIEAQTETQIAISNVPAGSIESAPAAAQDPYNNGATGTEFVQNDAPAAASDPFSVTPRSLEPNVENSSATNVSANQDSGLLTPAESIARAQTTAPADVEPANTGVFANPNFSQEAISGTPAPADVNPATDPGVKSPFGGAASNAAAAQNPEAAAAALQQEQANQAAAMKLKAQQEGAVQAEFQAPANGDWRVRLRLAPGATYLYKDANVKTSILAPLAASNGVVFPYMPTIQTTYNANYESVELTHSNYRGQFYKSSYVGDVQITGTFTAQDTAEANYLLAVIHFFRSVTKMFYGAEDPLRGAPPPLVYLIGLGQYQFNNQPCVVKTFNYSMPNDCDYIRTKPNNYNTNLSGRSSKPQSSANPISSVVNRLQNALLPQGAVPNVPAQGLLEMQSVTNIADATYVPTKCEIQLTLMPIQTRSQQSQQFNMQNFANGNLLKGGFW
jgi:hypothetical protein